MTDVALETDVRVVDTPLGASALAKAVAAGTGLPWSQTVPRDVTGWRAHAQLVRRQDGAWLEAITPALGSGAALLSRVGAGGVVVTTGQQAGLFGGPLYTLFKAMSARELARTIERDTGLPTAPVFWAATDDADFDEAASTVIATRDSAERLTLRSRPPAGVPMSSVRLSSEVEPLFARLERAAGSAADEGALAAARSFREGVTLGEAYVAMLRALLEPHGIAVIDASHESVAACARPALLTALRRAELVHDALAMRAEELRRSGYSPAVETDRDLSMVFAWETGTDGLPRKRRMTLAEAAGFDGDARLSGNVLLRPIVERQILPTMAYVAGPGELAYFAQVSAVADALDAQRPLAVPRWSGVLVPREIEEILRSLGLSWMDLRDPHGAEARVARAALPADAERALERLRADIDRELAHLAGILTPAALEGARGQFAHRMERLERRVLAACKHREQRALGKVAAARAVIFPFDKPQERLLNAVPMLARFGEPLTDAIARACATHARRLVTGDRVSA